MRSEMEINLQNYEMYFVRYIDNDLSKAEVEEVHLFLQFHPELRSDLGALQSTVLKPDVSLSFPTKATLKRSVHEGNFEDYCLRWIEQDLSPAEIKEVNAFLKQNPAYNKQLDAFKATRLVEDLSVVFPDKERLKKKKTGKVVPLYVRYLLSTAVAAGLLLLLLVKGVSWLPDNVDQPVAKVESKPETENADNAPSGNSNSNQPQSNSTNKNAPDQSIVASVREANPSQEKEKKESANTLVNNDKQTPVVAMLLAPLEVNTTKKLPSYQRNTKAPYLIPIYEDEPASQLPDPSNVNNAIGGWLSIASVFGTEILKLSGRGDMVKAADTAQPEKKKEALTLSIQTKKFSFYHKFLNKKNSSTKK